MLLDLYDVHNWVVLDRTLALAIVTIVRAENQTSAVGEARRTTASAGDPLQTSEPSAARVTLVTVDLHQRAVSADAHTTTSADEDRRTTLAGGDEMTTVSTEDLTTDVTDEPRRTIT